MTSYDGKTIIISGATGGIGREVTQKFSEYECNLILLHKNRSTQSQQYINKLSNQKAHINELIIDLTNPDEMNIIENLLQKKHLKVDFIINCVGIFLPSLLSNCDISILDKTLSNNLLAPISLIRTVFPYLALRSTSRIINISSVAAKKANIGQGIYAISKSALNTYTKCLAQELYRYKIPVNSISPGFVKTAMSEKYYTTFKNKVPFKRFASPTEVADLVLFLTSSMADYITGENFIIDGGFSNL